MDGSSPAAAPEHDTTSPASAVIQPSKAPGRMGAFHGWLWAAALISLLAFDVWMQTRADPASAAFQLLIWGLLLAVAVGGPWFLIRSPATGPALRAMPVAVLCYLGASLLVTGWPADTRYLILLLVAAALAGCAGMIIALADRSRRRRG